MDIKKLNKLLAEHGMKAEKTEDGVKLTEESLQALADCREPEEHYYVIKCRHEVDITYRVPGTSFEDALDKLAGRELFSERYSGCFGPDEDILFRENIEVVDTDCYTDPSGTGHSWARRDWEYEVEDSDGYRVDEDMAS